MAIDLYTLKKTVVMVLRADGSQECVHVLQLAVKQALSQDSQRMVDVALKHAADEWCGSNTLPKWVVQVGIEGMPKPGAPVYRWSFHKRPFCFDHELGKPDGYLGERTSQGGYHMRSVKEQERLRDLETAQQIDDGTAWVYKDFWRGELFESGEEFLKYRGGASGKGLDKRRRNGAPRCPLPPRVAKILSLIRLIERKGERASAADQHFLSCLKDKAFRLGHVL
jgi:hypothetical protein